MAARMKYVEAIQQCQNADRGDPRSIGQLLRALITGMVGLNNGLVVPAALGFTSGVGTVYKTSVQKLGGLIHTDILFDLTGLSSSTTDLDIIGVGANPAFMGLISKELCGTILTGTLTCLEVPAGGVTDIDLYYATVGTGVFDGLVTGLTGNTALVTNGGAWTLNLGKAIADPVALADKYLYLTCGAAGTPGAYTAGKFRLQLQGYEA